EGLRMGRAWAPDWGGSSGFGPAAGYGEGAGLIVGASYGATRYGFRRLPYAWTASVTGLYATGAGGFGVAADVDYRLENSRLALTLEGRATEFEAFRFYGFGNDSELLPDDVSLVMQDRVGLHPALTLHLGAMPGRQSESEREEEEEERGVPFGGAGKGAVFEGEVSFGPLLQWTSPRLPAGSPLAAADPGGVGQLGALLRARAKRTDRPAAPRRGFAVGAHASAYPALWKLDGHFGDLYAEAAAYLPLLGQTHLALRAGGERAFGDFPAFEAALLGGRTTLRGYRWNRFAGEGMAFGNAELRVPVDTVDIFFRGELGVFGIADAGRVWVDGASPGGWHTGFGGGAWFAFLGRALSAAYVSGEDGRAYVWLGLPY
ncbi:MAG TPA: BamA/TamA family outer membrane protein, partial [Longimicrobiales bacterium]|nr:BamA/TamA family outer membrane protein [Longimicrobiales bacterium]